MTTNSNDSNINNRLYDEWTLKCYNNRSDEELPLGIEDWLFAKPMRHQSLMMQFFFI